MLGDAAADRPAFREIARRLKAVAVRHGTIVPTTSSKLPLGPEARGSESSAHSSFSDERRTRAGSPCYKRKAHTDRDHSDVIKYPSCLVAVRGASHRAPPRLPNDRSRCW